MPNKNNITLPNYVGGEVSAYMSGRVDLELFPKTLKWCQNFVVLPQGGVSYRPGNYVVGLTKNNSFGQLIRFQFSANDAYIIVATNLKFRFYRNNGVILNTAKNISGISNASEAVVTSTSHGYSNGDEVFITGVEGMPEVHNSFFLVSDQTANTFKLKDQFGTYVDSQTFGVYAAAGTVASIYEVTSPYAEADLELLRYAQTADLMYLTRHGYAPRKLTRTNHTSWSIGTYSRTSDPFTTGTKYPALCSFTTDGRLRMANTVDNPEAFWDSRTPNGTTTRYDDYTIGTDPTNAIAANLSPVEGIIDSIEEMRVFGKHFVMLGASSVRRLFGETQETPPIPAAINTHPTSEGSARVQPLSIGSTLLFVDVSGKKLKGFKYNLSKDDFEAQNYNLVADQLGQTGVQFKKLVRVKGDPDAVWVLRSDGVLLSFTFNDNENIAGWARHYVGGEGIVEDIQTIRRDTGADQLWMIVKREMGGKTYRTIEVMSAWPTFPERLNFYTADEAEDLTEAEQADLARFHNAAWESVKAPTFLDGSLSFQGSDRGVILAATLTPSAVTGDSITIDSDVDVFLDEHIGMEVWKKYDSNGEGGGQAVITGLNSAQQAICKVMSDFDSLDDIAPGSWEFAVSSLKNLFLYEGLTVNIQADGSGHPDRVVTGGMVELQAPAATIHIGFKHKALLKTQNIDIGGRSGPANSKPRCITELRVRVKDSVGGKVGPGEYKLKEMVSRQASQVAGRVPPPYEGVVKMASMGHWDSSSKNVVIYHDKPTPLTVVAMDVECLTVDQT